MNDLCGNIYKSSRLRAYPKEPLWKVAQGLNYSERSLQYYESDEREVPDDVAWNMAAYYNDRPLLLEHLSKTSFIFRKLFGEYQRESTLGHAMGLMLTMEKFKESQFSFLRAIKEGCPKSREEMIPIFQELSLNLYGIMPCLIELFDPVQALVS